MKSGGTISCPVHSPSSALFVYIGDDGVLGEGELVVSLRFVVVHGFDCALEQHAGPLKGR